LAQLLANSAPVLYSIVSQIVSNLTMWDIVHYWLITHDDPSPTHYYHYTFTVCSFKTNQSKPNINLIQAQLQHIVSRARLNQDDIKFNHRSNSGGRKNFAMWNQSLELCLKGTVWDCIEGRLLIIETTKWILQRVGFRSCSPSKLLRYLKFISNVCYSHRISGLFKKTCLKKRDSKSVIF